MFKQLEKASSSNLEETIIPFLENNRKDPNILNDVENYINSQNQPTPKLHLLRTIYNRNKSISFAKNHATQLNLDINTLHKAIKLSIENHSSFYLTTPSYYGVMNNYYLALHIEEFIKDLVINPLTKKHYLGKDYDKHNNKFKLKNITLDKNVSGHIDTPQHLDSEFKIGQEHIEYNDTPHLDSHLNLVFHYNDLPQFTFSFLSTDKNTLLINQIQMFNLIYSSDSTRAGQLFRFKDSNSFDWKNIGFETLTKFISYTNSKHTTIERIGIIGHENNIWFNARVHRFTEEQTSAFKKNYDLFAITLGMKKEPDNNYYMPFKTQPF